MFHFALANSLSNEGWVVCHKLGDALAELLAE